MALGRVPSNFIRTGNIGNGVIKLPIRYHAKRYKTGTTRAKDARLVNNKKRVVSARRTRTNAAQNILQTLTQPLPSPLLNRGGNVQTLRKYLRRYWYSDVPQKEIDDIADQAGLDFGGAPVQYIRDSLWTKGLGPRLFIVAKNCRFPDAGAISDILNSRTGTCLTAIPETTDPPPTRVILCVSPNGKRLLLPIHDLVPSVHCFKLKRGRFTSEPWESPIEPGTTVALPVMFIQVPDVDMFKALWAWFYTRDDVALLKELVPILAPISTISCRVEHLLPLAQQLIQRMALIGPVVSVNNLMARVCNAHKIAISLGIVEHQPWALIDVAYRIFLATIKVKLGLPGTLSLDKLAPDFHA